ncbi:gliding motility-associated C-terminal domain-containing protein [Tellurirhabdus bombi]|uniref:gliding motility-associated C-terminal domain-containing protein n=1 Tax=Tellurirhabdus bombi TaxID=2907205 RepID=UPI001F2050CA|nr:gliding motility-associated C-terminal domain-containing protein [Tellurirhabdus bombi]
MKHNYHFLSFSLLCLFLLLGLSERVQATHIVGGELELQYLRNQGSANYRINLNLYFDELNGNPGAEDPTTNVYVFRKSDNRLMGIVTLPLVNRQAVSYSNPDCSISSLSTRLIRYSSDVSINTGAFNDPQGYYMVWERCCRNGTINNIQNPGAAGSVFYLEFPALVQNNNLFVNSSPVFRPLKGDYICINKPFTFDFGAADPDGDSLSYKLVTPYNGYSTSQLPSPPATASSAYPEVRWASGINLTQVIPGPRPLRVDAQSGLLTVTASQTGLYVFSVEVSEHRKINGRYQRIGLVRRDFQFKVIDCPVNNPPKLMMRQKGANSFYTEGSLVTLSKTDSKCVDLFITDRDANQRVRILPLTGNNQNMVITPQEVLIRNPGDTVKAQICFEPCAAPNGRTVTISLLAVDEGCPQGLEDTLRIRLQMEADPNLPPDVQTDLPDNKATVKVGQALAFNVTGTDPEKGFVSLEAVGRGFTLAQAGMTFAPVSGTATVTQKFQWTPQCSQVRNQEYVIDFIVTDTYCDLKQRDTVTVRLTAIPETNNKPSVRTTLTNPLIEMVLSVDGQQTPLVEFDAIASDTDPDLLKLALQGLGFDWKAMGMQFEDKSGRGPLTSPFSWKPGCAVLNGQPEATFVLDFLTEDNSCLPDRYDTTRVTLVVKDSPANYDIAIPNVFTPNNDGKNDVFSIPALPADNCAEQFRKIEIYNRWGRVVYSSTNRDFVWDGTGYSSGQYFYLIDYSKRQYKGQITLIRQ